MEKYYKWPVLALLLTNLAGCLDSSDDTDSIDLGVCSVPEANEQLFDYLQQTYLWNNELPETYDPNSAPDMFTAMDQLRVAQDRFSFVLTEEDYQSNFVASKFFGYGFGHSINQDNSGLTIRYAYEAGSAWQNGLRRGDTIIQVGNELISDLIPKVQANQISWSDVFGPNEDGYTIAVGFKKPSGQIINAEFSKSELVANTVMATETKQLTIDNQTKNVGYLVFDSFRDVSVDELNNAFDKLATDQVDEMVLDLRYNSGGLIRVANQLSSQISGDNVIGEIFLQYIYNDNLSTNNENNQVLFSIGQGLSKLNLDNLVVLTTQASCSASELVINALSPFVDVTVVGDRTCGKPIGMNPTEICDHRVFAINFETVNALGEGRYFDGLPAKCSAVDRIVGDWGDVNDPLLAEGLHYLQTGSCSQSSVSSKKVLKQSSQLIDFSKGPFASRNEI